MYKGDSRYEKITDWKLLWRIPAGAGKISWIWPGDVHSGSRNSSLHRNTGTGPQRWRTGDVADTGQDYFSEKCNGGNCGKRNVYPGISGLWKTGVWKRQ